MELYNQPWPARDRPATSQARTQEWMRMSESVSRADLEVLAKAYGDAVANGDNEALGALHESDAQVWHNTDDTTQTIEQNLKVNAWLHRRVPDLHFEDVQVTYTDNGFVRRNKLLGTAPNGSPFSAHTLLLVEVAPSGKITRVHEYLDSAPLAVLQAR
jgi:ketosteroid isomerase-like protein